MQSRRTVFDSERDQSSNMGMDGQPHINDYLDLIRPLLAENALALRKELKAIDNRLFSKGQTGAGISAYLDAAKSHLAAGAKEAFVEMTRVADKFDSEEIRQVTIGCLENFLIDVKAATNPERLKNISKASPSIVKIVDAAMAALDEELSRLIRQMRSGLLDVRPSQFSEHGTSTFDTAGQVVNQRRVMDNITLQATGVTEPVFVPSPQAPTTSSAGRVVKQNAEIISLLGTSLLLLIDARLDELKQARNNSDEAHKKIEAYENLKASLKSFLGTVSDLSDGSPVETEVVAHHLSFTEGLKNIWDQRHLQISDVGLLGVAATLCGFIDPVSVVVAGAVVGGKHVVEALKAAAELAKGNTH